jgi:hypothetical protein
MVRQLPKTRRCSRPLQFPDELDLRSLLRAKDHGQAVVDMGFDLCRPVIPR